MMVDRCPITEDLATILELPADDERRKHVDDCPRCRTLARRYREFLSPAPLPPEADAEAAGRALRERLTTALPELTPALETTDGGADRAGAERPATGRVRFGWQPSRRSLRPMVAVAAVLVCCLGLLAVRDQVLQPGTDVGPAGPVLRGDDLAPTALTMTTLDGASGLNLVWGQPADTDAAELVLIDAGLNQISRTAIGTSGSHDLLAPPATARYLRIDFLAGGDVVSSTRTVPVPVAH